MWQQHHRRFPRQLHRKQQKSFHVRLHQPSRAKEFASMAGSAERDYRGAGPIVRHCCIFEEKEISFFAFDARMKENAYMCHHVLVNACRSRKQLFSMDFNLVYDIASTQARARKRGFGCAGNEETLVVITIDFFFLSNAEKGTVLR